MARTFDHLLIAILFVGNVLCDICIGWRDQRIQSTGIDVKPGINTLPDCTSSNAWLCFNLGTHRNAPVDSIRHSFTITATSRLDWSQQLVVARRNETSTVQTKRVGTTWLDWIAGNVEYESGKPRTNNIQRH